MLEKRGYGNARLKPHFYKSHSHYDHHTVNQSEKAEEGLLISANLQFRDTWLNPDR